MSHLTAVFCSVHERCDESRRLRIVVSKLCVVNCNKRVCRQLT